MQILSPGTVTVPNPWWVGKTGQCTKCRAIVKLVSGDSGAVVDSGNYIDINCPTGGCGSAIRIQKQVFLTANGQAPAIPAEPISPE